MEIQNTGTVGRAKQSIKKDFIPALGIKPGKVYPPPSLLPRFLDGRAAVPCPCSVILHCSAVRRVGGFEESFRTTYEDQAFFAKICLSEPVYVSEDCLDLYRQHPKSSTSIAYRSGREKVFRSQYLDLSSYVRQMGIEDKEVKKASSEPG
jgi:hypothetical protein